MSISELGLAPISEELNWAYGRPNFFEAVIYLRDYAFVKIKKG